MQTMMEGVRGTHANFRLNIFKRPISKNLFKRPINRNLEVSFNRLWITTEVNKNFPIGLLQMSLKYTNEPPQGIR